jgi:hypothetical protein
MNVHANGTLFSLNSEAQFQIVGVMQTVAFESEADPQSHIM